LSCWITSDLNIAPALDYLDSLELERINHPLNTATANRCVAAANDLRRDEGADFDDETGIDESPGNGSAAFDEYALN
jgi:hypothetical protein